MHTSLPARWPCSRRRVRRDGWCARSNRNPNIQPRQLHSAPSTPPPGEALEEAAVRRMVRAYAPSPSLSLPSQSSTPEPSSPTNISQAFPGAEFLHALLSSGALPWDEPRDASSSDVEGARPSYFSAKNTFPPTLRRRACRGTCPHPTERARSCVGFQPKILSCQSSPLGRSEGRVILGRRGRGAVLFSRQSGVVGIVLRNARRALLKPPTTP